MDQLQKAAVAEITENATKVMKHLCELWTKCYNIGTVKDYINKLPKHVDDLFTDVVHEAESNNKMYSCQIKVLLESIETLSSALSETVDVKSFLKLPKREAIAMLTTQLQKFQQMHSDRLREVDELNLKERELCKLLDLECKALSKSKLPTKQEINEFGTYLEQLKSEKLRREMELTRMTEDLLGAFNELVITPRSDLEKAIFRGSKPEFGHFSEVEQLYSEYLLKIEISKNTLADLKVKLEVLWDLLEEPAEYRQRFLNAHASCDLENIRQVKEEIARCEETKKKNIKMYIENIRQRISYLWNMCMVSQTERNNFAAFSCETLTTDLLSLHEAELSKLQKFYEKHRTIFEMINKRTELRNKLAELETLAKSPNRYANRGGKLLLEEKERKKVVQQLPKVEEKLLNLVRQYQRETNNVFTVYGDSVEEILENAKREPSMFFQNRENKK